MNSLELVPEILRRLKAQNPVHGRDVRFELYEDNSWAFTIPTGPDMLSTKRENLYTGLGLSDIAPVFDELRKQTT